MNKINLLVWSEEWRRNDRREIVVHIVICLSVLLILAVGWRFYVLRHCHQVERRVVLLKKALNESVQKQNFLEKIVEDQNTRLKILEQKQLWRQHFSCHEAWLNKLGDILPESARVEEVKVQSGGWGLLIVTRQVMDLKELLRKLTLLSGLTQIQVRKINFDNDQNLVQIEFIAKVTC
ncbi:MAG: hypothetical protein K2X50_07325 [Gammaproteobacteria bacterium]|nr:hypothetical protein [Gammaproteobacteria bacterium]